VYTPFTRQRISSEKRGKRGRCQKRKAWNDGKSLSARENLIKKRFSIERALTQIKKSVEKERGVLARKRKRGRKSTEGGGAGAQRKSHHQAGKDQGEGHTKG